jgi:hypothetical protein
MKSRIIALFFILFAAVLTSGQTAERSLDGDEYKKAIELLFPLDVAERPIDFAIAFRVSPAFDPEFSVTLIASGDAVEITVRESKDGNLFYFLSSIAKTTELERAEELVKKVKLQTITTTMSRSNFRRHKTEFDKQIGRMLEDRVSRSARTFKSDSANSIRIPLDGTHYEIRFVNASIDEIRLSAYDYPLAASKFDHALVNWIKSVVQRIAKEPTFSKSAAIKASLN